MEHLYVGYVLYYIGHLNQAMSLTYPSTYLLHKADKSYKLALSIFSKKLRSDDICLAYCLGKEDLNVAKTLNNMAIVHARLNLRWLEKVSKMP